MTSEKDRVIVLQELEIEYSTFIFADASGQWSSKEWSCNTE